MPKYNVIVTKVATVVYDSTEIEAKDTTEATEMAMDMVDNDEIDEDSMEDKYTTSVTEVSTAG